jgi:hypothetical protein
MPNRSCHCGKDKSPLSHRAKYSVIAEVNNCFFHVELM